MGTKLRILYWLLAIAFVFHALAETGFFATAEGVVVGKKTYRLWGLPTGRRLVIKYQEPLEANPGMLVTRYHRIPVVYAVFKNFKKGDRFEHYKLSLVFFQNDEPLGLSWDTRWTISLACLLFFFTVAYQYGWPRLIRYGKSIPHRPSIRYGRSLQSH